METRGSAKYRIKEEIFLLEVVKGWQLCIPQLGYTKYHFLRDKFTLALCVVFVLYDCDDHVVGMGGDNGDVVGSQIAHEVSIGAEDGMRSHSSFILVYK